MYVHTYVHTLIMSVCINWQMTKFSRHMSDWHRCVRIHIAVVKKQKSFGASTNVKPRAGVFPLTAKIWDVLDEGCSCRETERQMQDKRAWYGRWRKREKERTKVEERLRDTARKRWNKNEETEKRRTRSLKDFTSVSSFLLPTAFSYFAVDGSLVPDYFPPWNIPKDPLRTRKILDSVSLRRKRK